MLPWFVLFLFIAVFSCDLLSPLGVAAGVAYVPLVLCSLWFRGVRLPFFFAAIATLLTVIGYFLSRDMGVAVGGVLVNRTLSVMSIWLTAFIVYAQKRTQLHLEEVNKELEEFAYRTSHDLRSPLLSAISLLKVVRDGVDNDKPDRVQQGLSHAETSLKKLEVLVSDILCLTKIKHEEEDIADIDVEALIDGCIDKFSYMENFNRIEFRKDLCSETQIKSKENRVRLIIENLISNAIKYQDLSQDQSYVHIRTFKEGGSFIFKVEDNGQGIPAQYHESLFQMFKRFHSKISFGSGLGLYMVRRSATILGGDISFEPSEEGSIFILRIPI